MKTRFLLCLVLALTGWLAGCSTTYRRPDSGMSATAPVVDGLQMVFSTAKTAKADDPEFRVAIRNAGDKDTTLNLGETLANGQRQFPTKIGLNLTDREGKAWKLKFMGPGAVAGRMDDYVVPLRAGSTYTVLVRLNQFILPNTADRPKLDGGWYHVHAEFQGTDVETGSLNSDMAGVKLMNFWQGTLESNEVTIKINNT